jgi:UDP-apiose/xylose synthase
VPTEQSIIGVASQPVGSPRANGKSGRLELSPEAVLGREVIDVGTSSLWEYLSGAKVLVTGCAGSIGKRLCPQLVRLGVAELVIVDQAEIALLDLASALRDGLGFVHVTPVLADIRSRARANDLLRGRRVDAVFHLAAYKQVPLLEANPVEAAAANVLGTRWLVESARRADVERFVFFSTDKAVRPTSVLGRTKAVAEWIVASAGLQEPHARYVSVRLGNVMDSAGSFFPLVREQIARGGPVTLTHPEMTRFLMTSDEAGGLALAAGGLAEPGRVYWLDLRPATRLVDVARRLIDLASSPAQIVFVGPRDGDRLHEQLFSEAADTTSCEQVFSSAYPPIDAARLERWLDELGRRVDSASTTGVQEMLAGVERLESPTQFRRRTRRAQADTLKRVVILGCGGFIGSHLAERLLEDHGVHVAGWDTSIDKIAHLLDHPRFDLEVGSFASPAVAARLAAAIRDANVVINLASICRPSEYNVHPVRVIRSNFTDACAVAELCARQRTWLLHFSTSEVYGRTIASYASPGAYGEGSLFELDEEVTPLVLGPVHNQRWSYAAAKQLLERLIVALALEEGLSFTIIRPFNFFGPRMDFIPGRDGDGLPRVLASFMTALLDGEPLRVVDGGVARRTIISIRDAIDAVVLMLEHRNDAENQIFNIGNPANEVSMLELAVLMRRTYAEITGEQRYERHPIKFVSGAELYGEGYEDCDRRMPRVDRALERLGWSPRISLEDVLRETMSYYHAQYGAPRLATRTELVV